MSGKKSFDLYIKSTKQLIESALSDLLSKNDDLKLHKRIEYACHSKGKRLRPLMVIMGAQSVGGNPEDVMQLALAIELLHTATLVHDDILDQDEFRRNLPTIHEKWSVNDAILVGDALISLAVNLTADYGREIMKLTSETGLELCEGEYIDVSYSSIESSEKENLERIEKKSASLFRTATKCGALAAGGSSSEIKCLANYGENFGMAYQLVDDLSDMTSLSEGIPKDFRRRRMSLPLIHLRNAVNPDERERLIIDLEILAQNKKPDEKVFNRILRNLESKGSLQYCRMKIDEYINRSIKDLQPLKETVFKIYLKHLAEFLRTNSKRNMTEHIQFSIRK
jgi:geranylgeranyl pyrophosphate synthase